MLVVEIQNPQTFGPVFPGDWWPSNFDICCRILFIIFILWLQHLRDCVGLINISYIFVCIPNIVVEIIRFWSLFLLLCLDLAAAFSSALAPLPSPRPGGTWRFVNRILKFQLKFQKWSPIFGPKNLEKEFAHPNRWGDKHTLKISKI